MKRFAIWAGDQTFYGLHGLYSIEIVTALNKAEAEGYAYEMSEAVIDNYDEIYDEIESEAYVYAEDNRLDLNDVIDEFIEDDIAYEVYEIDEDEAGEFTTDELKQKLIYMNWVDFVNKYCLQDYVLLVADTKEAIYKMGVIKLFINGIEMWDDEGLDKLDLILNSKRPLKTLKFEVHDFHHTYVYIEVM